MSKKSSFGTADIRCPFFRYHEPMVIGCEGITDDSTIRMVFDTRDGRDLQERIFCKGRYHYCEIYRAVYAKYEEMEGE